MGYLGLPPVKSLNFQDLCGYIALSVKPKLEKWKRACLDFLPPTLSYCVFSTVDPVSYLNPSTNIPLLRGVQRGLWKCINTKSSAYDSSASYWSQGWSWDPVWSPAALTAQWWRHVSWTEAVTSFQTNTTDTC